MAENTDQAIVTSILRKLQKERVVPDKDTAEQQIEYYTAQKKLIMKAINSKINEIKKAEKKRLAAEKKAAAEEADQKLLERIKKLTPEQRANADESLSLLLKNFPEAAS